MQIAGVAAEQLFVDFVNSEWYDGRGRFEEHLLDPVWRAWFVSEWGIDDPGEPSGSMLRRLLRLRDATRGTVEDAYLDRVPSTREIARHAQSLSSIPMRLEIFGEPPIAGWGVATPSWAHIEGEVIRTCLEFLASPARGRLRRCRNEGCRWAFVDASRNGSRRWCDPGICGNVSKVRAYRKRHKRR